MEKNHINTLVEKFFGQVGGQNGEITGASPDIAVKLLEKILSQQAGDDSGNSPGCSGKNKKITLTPAKILVLLGILGGVFEVNSLLVDKDQVVQVLLVGSLKRKTKMDSLLDNLGPMTFDEIMQAVMDRFG